MADITDVTPKRKLRYGGLDILAVVPEDSASIKACALPQRYPGQYLASLLDHLSDPILRLGALVTLSPLYVATQLWVANAMQTVVETYDVDHVYYVGSRFGQQHALFHQVWPESESMLKTFLEPNLAELNVGDQALRAYPGAYSRALSHNLNASQFDWSTLDPDSLVVWANVEQYSEEDLCEALAHAPESTTWVVTASTTRDKAKLEDEANLIMSLDDLSKYFNVDSEIEGELRTVLESRFMAVFKGS